MRRVCDACKDDCGQPIAITDMEGQICALVCNDCKLALLNAFRLAFQSIQDSHP